MTCEGGRTNAGLLQQRQWRTECRRTDGISVSWLTTIAKTKGRAAHGTHIVWNYTKTTVLLINSQEVHSQAASYAVK
jgi:hypothetical protein